MFFFFKHKITNFRELLLYYRNKFKQLLSTSRQHKNERVKITKIKEEASDWLP